MYIQESESIHVLRRAQSIFLLKRYNISAHDVAEIVGLSPGTVNNLKYKYRKNGLAALQSGTRGGRRRSGLSHARECALIETFSRRARSTGQLSISGLKGAYEQLTGRTCALSTIYRMVHRHGLDKMLPRRRVTTFEREFKKNRLPVSRLSD